MQVNKDTTRKYDNCDALQLEAARHRAQSFSAVTETPESVKSVNRSAPVL